MIEATKTCCTCKRLRATSDFARRAAAKDGLQDRCKTCAAESGRAWREAHPKYTTGRQVSEQAKQRARLMYKYGLTPETYESLLEEQSGRCAICSDKLVKPHIDHCHTTGAVRGILCPHCNIGIGHFRDDPARLLAAAEYLRTLQ